MTTSKTANATVRAPVATPPYPAAVAAAVYALATLALMYPALTGRFLVNPMSDMLVGATYRTFGGEWLRQTGHFAQWDTYLLGGIPFMNGQHGDMFYPVLLFRTLFPINVAINLSFASHIFLAGLFAYCFLRAYGLSFYPALTGGAGYMLCGQIASLVSPGHDGKLYVSALAPLLLWMLVRGMRDGRNWAWGVIAITTALCILSPHVQMTYYLGVLAIGFTFYLAFQKGEGALEPATRWRRLIAAGLAAGLGLALAAVALFPLFGYLPVSPRGGQGRGYEYATSWAMAPEELLNGYLPQFSGVLEKYWGQNPFKLHSDYLGAALLMLSGAAVGTKRRSFAWFWVASIVLALLVSFGGHTPFYHLWYLLPMMKQVRAPAQMFFIVCLAVSVLAALGVERLLDQAVPRRYWIWWGAAAGLVALIATAGGFEALGQALAMPGRSEAVAENASAVLLGAWRSFAVIALAVLLVLAWYAGRVPAAAMAWGLVAIVLVDEWSAARPFFKFSAPASELYRVDPATDYLMHLKEPGRTVALPLSDSTIAGDPLFDGDALMLHRVRTVTGHEADEPQSWVDLAGGKSPAPPRRITDPNFRRLANVKYWLTNVDLPAVVPQLGDLKVTKLVGPVPDAVGNALRLYAIDESNPPAWLAPVVVKAEPPQILATVLDGRFDPRTAALFDTTLHANGVALTTPPAPLDIPVTVPRYDNGHITVQLGAPAPAGSALVVSENYYHGWEATVDGKPAATARADYTFIGVPLPAGARTVDLTFHDLDFAKGVKVTLLAILVTAGWMVGGIVVDRRRARTAGSNAAGPSPASPRG